MTDIDLSHLSERRKADRATMAHHIIDLASTYRLAAWVRPEQDGTRQTAVDLAGPHGLRLTIEFRGDSPHRKPDTYVLSWHGIEDGYRLDPLAFCTINPHHGHKATDIANGFQELIELLTSRFTSITDGSAYKEGN